MAFNPNDYGKILTLESCRKIKIDDLVRQARRVFGDRCRVDFDPKLNLFSLIVYSKE